MKNIKCYIPCLSTKEKGVTMVEYAIMLALITVVAIAAVSFLGQNLSTTFSSVASSLPGG